MPYHTLQFFFNANSAHVEQKTPLSFMTETKIKIFRIQSKWYKRAPYVKLPSLSRCKMKTTLVRIQPTRSDTVDTSLARLILYSVVASMNSVTRSLEHVCHNCHQKRPRPTQRHQWTIRTQQLSQEDVERYVTDNRALKTTVFVVVSVSLCLVPMCLYYLLRAVGVHLVKESHRAMFRTFLMLNSFLNPLVYCWQQKEIGQYLFKCSTQAVHNVDW